ncbi:MAG: 16S rRNA (guanine(966)-N(2))-methyltransferase RsmD [Clostridia bacterium]|nr:16S rRNA (guanine(966)-N(2))-methyltransferase RsmD [Clostridia bacterium]
MRIISGTMRGTKLFTLEGDNTRPTLDRVKEALFSKINFDIQDSIILDLFAGSGALALEALSRGAKKTYLCDNSRDAIKIINQNIEKTKTKDKIVLLNMDYQKALDELQKNEVKLDIVFLDPPYKTNYAEEAAKYIVEHELLNDKGFIIIETDDKEKVLKNIDTNILEIKEIKKYGRVFLLFLYSK